MLRLRTTLMLGLALALAGLAFTSTAEAQQATLERVKRVGEIKVCVDQNNLPYSSDKPETPGFDVEIAREIAKEMGLKLGYNWFATNVGKRALRQMVGEGNCDFFLGLPKDESFEENNFKLILSKPYYTGGFATLVRADAPATALADAKKKGVGVQLGTYADFKMFDKGFERKLYKNAKEMFDAVEHKDIDAAVTPAPEGAWLVKSSGNSKLKILPNSEKEFLFQMAIGVRKADADLKDAIDVILEKMRGDGRIAAIMAKYGMPQLYAEGSEPPKTEAPKSGAAEAAEAPPKAEAPKVEAPKADAPKADAPKTEAPKAEAPKAEAPKAAAANSDSTSAHQPGHYSEPLPDDQVVDPTKVEDFPSDPKTVDDGRKLYKQACYKCHGPNGVSGGTIPDLRIYASKNNHYDMFAVVQGGRLEKGMPSWAPYLDEKEIKSIIVYVKSLPKIQQ
jgi:polar amino acid transport system substrate-binding protein